MDLLKRFSLYPCLALGLTMIGPGNVDARRRQGLDQTVTKEAHELLDRYRVMQSQIGDNPEVEDWKVRMKVRALADLITSTEALHSNLDSRGTNRGALDAQIVDVRQDATILEFVIQQAGGFGTLSATWSDVQTSIDRLEVMIRRLGHRGRGRGDDRGRGWGDDRARGRGDDRDDGQGRGYGRGFGRESRSQAQPARFELESASHHTALELLDQIQEGARRLEAGGGSGFAALIPMSPDVTGSLARIAELSGQIKASLAQSPPDGDAARGRARDLDILAQTTDDIFNSSPLLRMRSGDWKGLHARIEYLTGLFSLDEGSTIVGSR